MTRSARRAAVLCCLALAILAPDAGAHARLLGSIPASGAVIDSGRHTVSFKFGDAVEAALAAIRIYGPQRRLVATGATFHPGRDPRWIKVRSTSERNGHSAPKPARKAACASGGSALTAASLP